MNEWNECHHHECPCSIEWNGGHHGMEWNDDGMATDDTTATKSFPICRLTERNRHAWASTSSGKHIETGAKRFAAQNRIPSEEKAFNDMAGKPPPEGVNCRTAGGRRIRHARPYLTWSRGGCFCVFTVGGTFRISPLPGR